MMSWRWRSSLCFWSCSFSVFPWAAASLHRWRRRNCWEENGCCCCGVRGRLVWGSVDRDGCFGCREEMAERGEWQKGGGLVLVVLSFSLKKKTELSAFPLKEPPSFSFFSPLSFSFPAASLVSKLPRFLPFSVSSLSKLSQRLSSFQTSFPFQFQKSPLSSPKILPPSYWCWEQYL